MSVNAVAPTASSPARRARLGELPLNLFFCCLGAFLYTPVLVLYLSHNAGNFTLGSLAGPVIVCLASLAIPCALWMRWPVAVDVLDSLLLAPAIYILVAATFFPVAGSVLDGTERTVAAVDRRSHVGLMGICVCIALVAVARRPVAKTAKRAARFLGVFALAASAYMAASVLPLRAASADNARYSRALSPKQNVIVVLFDMLQGGFASDYFTRNPAAGKNFDGFVFYRNAASFAPFTALSYAGFMSGGYPAGDQVHAGSVRDTIYYKDNIIDDMAAAGYATRYFSVITYENDNQHVIRIPDDIGVIRKSNFLFFALAVRGRYLPYSYLPFGITLMPWTQLEFGWLSKTDARDSFKWLLENVDVDRNIDKGFLWYHTLLTHQPIRFDAAGDFSLNLTPDDAHGEVAYAFGLLRQLVGRLEKIGAYDNSLVIVIADHGYNILHKMKELPADANYSLAPFGAGMSVGQYNPVVMVKRPGAHGRLRYDDSAISLLDLRKSLKDFVAPGSADAMEGFDFLGSGKGRPDRTVPVIRFVGPEFAPKDFLELGNWRRDTLRLPFASHYERGGEDGAPSRNMDAESSGGR